MFEMVATPEKVNVLLSIAGLLLIWAIWSFGLRPALIDTFRQRVFEIRDEMFDYAAAGNIDFNHPAYGTIRTLMNGYIRFAHRIDPALILISAVYFIFKRDEVRKAQRELKERIELQLSTLPEEHREKLSGYMERTQSELGKYILYGSPLFTFAVFTVGLPVLLVARLIGKVSIRERAGNLVRLLDPAAFSEAKRNHAAVA